MRGASDVFMDTGRVRGAPHSINNKMLYLRPRPLRGPKKMSPVRAVRPTPSR
jgi:hypothetical protein